MTDQDSIVTRDLTPEQTQFLLEYAVNKIVEEEILKRKKPALLQPKGDRFRDLRDPPHPHPAYFGEYDPT